MIFSMPMFSIFGAISGVFVAGVFLACRFEGKSCKDSLMATMGWGMCFAAYFIADYLTMATSIS